jgi:hypothetical protein
MVTFGRGLLKKRIQDDGSITKRDDQSKRGIEGTELSFPIGKKIQSIINSKTMMYANERVG